MNNNSLNEDVPDANSLVSVIIPNYNQEKYISRAIDSILGQTYPEIEIIVVDDGSTDSSEFIIERYGKRISSVRKNNGGAASARNSGISKSKGKYICFLDADDYLNENFIFEQVTALQQSGNLLVYCRMNIVNSNGQFLGLSTESREGDFKPIFRKEFGSTPFPPSSILIDSTILENDIKWNVNIKRYAEDYEFIAKCALHTNFTFNNSPLVFHSEHSESLTSQTTISYLIDNLIVMRNILTIYGESSPIVWLAGLLRVFKIFSLSYIKQFYLKFK